MMRKHTRFLARMALAFITCLAFVHVASAQEANQATAGAAALGLPPEK
jgi:hypothetical protein